MPLGEVELVELPEPQALTDPAGVSIDLWPWGVLIIFLGVYAVAAAALLAAGRREDARAVAGFIPDCAVLVSRLARDPRISRPRRALLFVVLGYLALPIDIVPDFLPGRRPARRRRDARPGPARPRVAAPTARRSAPPGRAPRARCA